MGDSKASTDPIIWDTEAGQIITRIQKDELRNTWLHNRMYETLMATSVRLGWAITLLGLISSILGFLLASIQSPVWQYSGGIISGIVGLIVSFLSRQSDRLNLSSTAEHHRLTAASHSGLYDDISLMKARPTQSAAMFLQQIKMVLKEIRDNSVNLGVSDEVQAEWLAECQKRNIHENDTFDRLGEIVRGLSQTQPHQPPQLSHPVEQQQQLPQPSQLQAQTPDPNTSLVAAVTTTTTIPVNDVASNINSGHDSFEDVSAFVNMAQPQPQLQPQPQPQPLAHQSTLRQPDVARGYDSKKLAYELNRLQDWE